MLPQPCIGGRPAVAGAVGRVAPRDDSNSPENAISVFAARLELGFVTALISDSYLQPHIFAFDK